MYKSCQNCAILLYRNNISRVWPENSMFIPHLYMKKKLHTNERYVKKRYPYMKLSSGKPHKCNICDAVFSRKRNIEIHISGVYEKKKPYKCLICDGSFTPNDSLSKGLSMFNSRQIIFKKPIIEESHFGRL